MQPDQTFQAQFDLVLTFDSNANIPHHSFTLKRRSSSKTGQNLWKSNQYFYHFFFSFLSIRRTTCEYFSPPLVYLSQSEVAVRGERCHYDLNTHMLSKHHTRLSWRATPIFIGAQLAPACASQAGRPAQPPAAREVQY